MPQQFIPVNLPLYIQCLSVPVKWRLATKLHPTGSESPSGDRKRRVGLPVLTTQTVTQLDPTVLEVEATMESETVSAKPTTFDPWEKRREFFALKSDDTGELLKFLPTVGLFEFWGQFHESEVADRDCVEVPAAAGLPFRVEYPRQVQVSEIWKARRLLENSLQSGGRKGEIGDFADFRVRLTRYRGLPRVNITTTTFLESMLLTLAIDRISDAKVGKCARPDCQVLFATTTGHDKKYCQRYCAHIESVRRDREKKKQLSSQVKGR